MNTVDTILEQMSHITAYQTKFISALLMTLICYRGKANFRNLSRYSHYHEKTYSRWFRREFDFVKFNSLSLSNTLNKGNRLVAATDCSFISKSGKHTHGLGIFYNGKQSKAEKGLEISTLSIVDVDYNTAYHLSTYQTAADNKADETRIDQYVNVIKKDRSLLPESIDYLVADGYYSKTKFIDGVIDMGLELIGKLRGDANLRWLYEGEQKAKGRHRLYDGKVCFEDLRRFSFAYQIGDIKLYTAVVNSPKFKRNLRVVYLVKNINGKIQTAILFSTDINIDAKTCYEYYKARFQIEFLFRDAKQFTGLTECQARHPKALHLHFNAAMTALNLIKIEDRKHAPDDQPKVISIASWKMRKANEHLLQRFSINLGLDFSSIKSSPMFQALCDYGAIAA